MASAALTALRRVVTVDWPKHANDDAKRHLIGVAKAGHAKIMADAARQGGAVPTFEAYGGSPGRPIESVKPPQEAIVYRYFYVREVARVAVNELIKASPFVSGTYARGHTIFLNDEPVKALPTRLKPSDRVFISNPVPYARRLEVGKTKSGRAFVMQVPPRIYERVARRLAGKYRSVARIYFGYVTIPDAHTIRGKLSPTYGVREQSNRGTYSRIIQRKRRQRPGTKVQAPAIFIEFEQQ